jgi:DNA polymerase-3 subunit delta'
MAEAPPDEIDPLAPRRNPDLVGHGRAEAELARLAQAGRLPHALLIAGPRGIGKATLAYRFARWLLARPTDTNALFAPPPVADLVLSPEHPVARRVASGGHADLLTVERGWDPKRNRRRGEILVEDARSIADFLHLTPAEGGWRVVIVDSADEMNRNGANALLKILEEPPRRAVLILISHAPGRLLPTIRSRCRRLVLEPLADDEVATLLRVHRPDLTGAPLLAGLAEGSIGRALELADADGIALYEGLIGLIQALPNLDGVRLQALADRVAPADAAEAFRTLFDLMADLIARLVAGNASGAPRIVSPIEADLFARLAGAGRLDRWIGVWENLRALAARTEGLNLDRRQAVLEAGFALEAAAR